MVWGIYYPLGLAKRETFSQELAENISGYTPASLCLCGLQWHNGGKMKSFWIISATLLITGCSGIEKIVTVLFEGLALAIMASLIIGTVTVIYRSISFFLPKK